MPCFDGGYVDEQRVNVRNQLLNEKSRLESMLCGGCRILEAFGVDIEQNVGRDVAKWFEDHKAEDAKRESKEAQREANRQRLEELAQKDYNEMDEDDVVFLERMKVFN